MWKRSLTCWIVVAAAGLMSGPTWSAGSAMARLSDIAGGPTGAVAVSGSLAVYSIDTTLRVVDLSAPEAPIIVAELTLDERPRAVEIADGRACVATASGLLIVDLSPPETPTVIGSLELSGIGSFAVHGGYAFVLAGSAVVTVDLADPAQPVETARHEMPGLYRASVALVADHLYAVTYDGEGLGSLHILALSSPSSPVEVGVLDSIDQYDPYLSPGGSLVEASASTVYLGHAGQGLRVIDVTDPSLPHQVAHLPDMRNPSLALVGEHLVTLPDFCLDRTLKVVDVSTPAAPVTVGSLGGLRNWGSADLAVSGTTVLITAATTGSGLGVVDLGDPEHPVEVAAIHAPQWVTDLAVAGDLLFVSDGAFPWLPGPGGAPPLPAAGLRIYDAFDPGHPVEIGSALAGTRVDAVEVRGGFAFLGLGLNLFGDLPPGLVVLDVSAPSSPVVAAAVPFETPATAHVDDLVLIGDHAYVAVDTDHSPLEGLYIFDVSDPHHPELESLVQGFVSGLASDGTDLYLLKDGELVVLDLTDPAHPLEVAAAPVPLAGHPAGLAVSDGWAYVAGGHVLTFDLSGPEPALVGVYPTGAWARDITVTLDKAHVATEGGLLVLSVSDPSAPVEIWRSGVGTRAVTTSGQLAFAGGESIAIIDSGSFLGEVVFKDGFEDGDLLGWDGHSDP